MQIYQMQPTQTRHKRLSKEAPNEEGLLPTPTETINYVTSHRSMLFATFIIASVWFGQVVTPLWTELSASPVAPPPLRTNAKTQKLGMFLATGTGLLSEDAPRRMPTPAAAPAPAASPTADKVAFTVTCALVHTVIVMVGIALGRDTRVMSTWGSAQALLRAGVASFAFLCAVLYLAWEFQIGPVPAAVGAEAPWAAKLGSEGAFVLIGAASMSVWLACSMLVPFSKLGDKALKAPSLHGGITAVGTCMALFDMSAATSLAVFVVAGSIGLLASRSPRLSRHAIAWNL